MGSTGAIEVVNPLDEPHWDELVAATGRCSVFHSAGWARVLLESYRYEPRYFVVRKERELEALVPVAEVRGFTGKRGVSVPFADQVEPMAADRLQFRAILDEVLRSARERRWRMLHLKGGGQYLPGVEPSVRFVVHSVPLGDEQRVFSGFRESTKRNVRKALAEGVSVTISDSRECLREFQRLNCLTRRRHGLPPQPGRFFSAIHEHLIAKGKGFVVLGCHGGKRVAAAVFFRFGGQGLYKYGASDERAFHLRANNLVIWEGMRECCRSGCTTFSFGRSDLEDRGLRQFKDGWGTTEETLGYYRYDVAEDRFIAGSERRLEMPLLRLMPLSVLKIAGSLAYRHMG